MASGTEMDILISVARLKRAAKSQIRREVGFSLGYIEYVCQYLVRKGYLDCKDGHYSMTVEGKKLLPMNNLSVVRPGVTRDLVREVAGEVAREVSSELKETLMKVRAHPRSEARVAQHEEKGQIKIRTDIELPVEDESLVLESNIDRIGAQLEMEKSDIDKSVEAFGKISKARGKKDA